MEKKRGKKQKRRKNERKKKKVSHRVSKWRPNDHEGCTLAIALHKILRILCYIHKAACTSSLIRTYRQTERQTDTGRDIVASAMKQIATKTQGYGHFKRFPTYT